MDTLLTLWRRRVADDPDRLAFTAIDGHDQEIAWSWRALDRRARATQRALLDQGSVRPGDRVLVVCRQAIDFLPAFIGSLYAGALPVPVPAARHEADVDRLIAIRQDAGADVALVIANEFADTAAARALGETGCRWIAVPAGDESGEREEEIANGHAAAVAYLQYTSGSTASPKGVMMTHANVLSNLAAIDRGFAHRADDVLVSWLPHFHDMGLVYGLLMPLFAGCRGVLLSPAAFIQQPIRWLRAMTRHGGTHSGGPNFAFEICAARISRDEMARLDLRRWRVAFNGAEPIQAETLDRFANTFAACGFDRRAFAPAYGLAEATLKVTSAAADEEPRACAFDRDALRAGQVRVTDPTAPRSRLLVGCGQVDREITVVVRRRDDDAPCADGEVGELWVSGAGVSPGYWQQPEATATAFPTREGTRFLRTGDLGFFHEQQLFIAGRAKDLLIVHGQNHHPEDLERTVVTSIDSLRTCGCAAFAEEDESLVFVQELPSAVPADLTALALRMRGLFARKHHLVMRTIVFVKLRRLPRTTSGKVQRYRCGLAYRAGELEPIFVDTLPESAHLETSQWPNGRASLRAAIPSERQALVTAYLARCLGTGGDPGTQIEQREQGEQSLARHGVDSLAAGLLITRVSADLGVELTFAELFASTSIDDLAARIVTRLEAQERRAPAAATASAEATEAAENARTAQAANAANATDTADTADTADAADTTDAANRAGAAGAASVSDRLSYGQEALWYQQATDRRRTADNLVRAFVVESPCDAAALARRFGRLVAEHDALRTSYELTDDGPRRRPCLDAPPLLLVDAREWRGGDLLRVLATEAARPFDLARGPLLRATLYRRRADSVLLLAAHHLAVDLWSLLLIVRALFTAKEHDTTGLALAPAPPFGRFVDWERTLMRGPIGKAHEEYWRRALPSVPPRLELPAPAATATATARGTAGRAPKEAGERVIWRAPAAISDGIRRLAASAGVTEFSVLFAAFQCLLARLSGQRSFAIGVPAACRHRAEWRTLVGSLANPLVMPCELSDEESFATFLERVHRQTREALDHQEYPFPLLVHRLQPPREAGRMPLFDVMFAFQQLPGADGQALSGLALSVEGAPVRLGETVIRTLPIEMPATPFELLVWMGIVDDTFVGTWTFARDHFDRETMARFTRCFERLLDGIVRDPFCRLGRIDLLADEDRHTIVKTWNATARPEWLGQRLPDLIDRQIARTPDALAVVTDDVRWSYRTLAAHADAIAAGLREGMGPDQRVGVYMERGAPLVAALLGVHRAGAAYVPLDPTYPAARIELMIRDLQPGAVLADPALAPRLATSGVPVLMIDPADSARDDPLTPVAAEGSVPAALRPDHLAYIIYTSGSTGVPKGAMNTHEAIVTRLLWMQAAFALSSADCVLQKTPFSFDVSVWEFFWPLITGARLVLAAPGRHRDTDYLIDLIDRHQVTVIHFVPSMLRAFLEASDLSRCRSLRHVICSGEALGVDLQRRFFESGLTAQLHNLYGPTEAAVDVSAWTCVPGDARPVPIGRPVANTQLHVLDRARQPVPVGVTGELYIGGHQLARGYWRQAGLTAARFVPDPLGGAPGRRLYRTGDLARWRSDGQLEFLGRIDDQVKIRGHRIEPGEIESGLRRHPSVRDAVVTVWHTEADDHRRLAAYIVPTDAAMPPDPADLRRHLAVVLPEALLPAVFIPLDRLPRTTSGKIDKRALPAPTVAPTAGVESQQPSTEAERLLARIWSDVLGVAHVGLDDNFIELGGDSIISLRVIARARRAGWRIRARQFFDHQTVRALAAHATRDEPEPKTPAATSEGGVEVEAPVEAVVEAGPVPFSPMQSWWIAQGAPEHFTQGLALRVRDEIPPTLLHAGLHAVVARHDALRWRAAMTETGWQAWTEPAEPGPLLTVIDLTALPPESRAGVRARASAALHRRWSLARGPLLRAAWFRDQQTDSAHLVVVMHHTVIDAVSWGIVLEDWTHACEQIQAGRLPALLAPPTAWRTWALQALTPPGEQDPPPRATIDTGALRTPVKTLRSELGRDVTQALIGSATRVWRASMEELLAVGVAVAHHRRTGERSVPLIVERHGRDDARWDLSRTVGWFTTLLPITLALDANVDLADAVRVVKQIARASAPAAANAANAAGAATAVTRPEAICINYLGIFERLARAGNVFVPVREEIGPTQAADAPRAFALDVTAIVHDGRLQIEWTLATSQPASWLEALAGEAMALLTTLSMETGTPSACLTPSDFPLATLDQATLEALVRSMATSVAVTHG